MANKLSRLNHVFFILLASCFFSNSYALNQFVLCQIAATRATDDCHNYYRQQTRIDRSSAKKIRKKCLEFADSLLVRCGAEAIVKDPHVSTQCAFRVPNIPLADDASQPNMEAVACWNQYFQKSEACIKKIKGYKTTHSYKRSERVAILKACKKEPKETLLTCVKKAIKKPLSEPPLMRSIYDNRKPWKTLSRVRIGTAVNICVNSPRRTKGNKMYGHYYRGKIIRANRPLNIAKFYIKHEPAYRVYLDKLINHTVQTYRVKIPKLRAISSQAALNRFTSPNSKKIKLRYPTKRDLKARNSRQKILAVLKENYSLFEALAVALKKGTSPASLSSWQALSIKPSDKEKALSTFSLKDGVVTMVFKKDYLGKPLTLAIKPIAHFKPGEVFYNCFAETKKLNEHFLPDICRFRANPFHYQF